MGMEQFFFENNFSNTNVIINVIFVCFVRGYVITYGLLLLETRGCPVSGRMVIKHFFLAYDCFMVSKTIGTCQSHEQ